MSKIFIDVDIVARGAFVFPCSTYCPRNVFLLTPRETVKYTAYTVPSTNQNDRNKVQIQMNYLTVNILHNE